MLEYETFVYLDVQKTGSSFIVELLRSFCKEKEIRKAEHAGIAADYDRTKLYFISVRDPYDQYVSLYSFGCNGDGLLVARLRKMGYGNLYDGTWSGFQSWLGFVLAPENAAVVGGGYGGKRSGKIGKILGFQSYRVFCLAVPDANLLLAGCRSKEAISKAYKANSVVSYIVRYESFRADLAELVRTKLRGSISDLTEALKFIETEQPRNTSERVDRLESNPKLDDALKRLLKEREWLMYEEFGY